MATNGNQKVAKVALFFRCNLCDYTTSKKCNYDKHVLTAKHQNRLLWQQSATNGNAKVAKVAKTTKYADNYICTICERAYHDRSGLWRHTKKCINSDIVVDTETILDIMKENQEFKQLLVDQYQESQKIQKFQNNQNQNIQQQLIDLMKTNVGMLTTTTNTNTITATNCNNTNNKFNLNVFLNETCKDAMNITDFIASLQMELKDLEYTGENGYAAGVSKIFLRELNQLDICKRPIHCTDIKREVFHIKNKNTWDKEKQDVIRVIKEITRKNVCLLQEWRETHPGCDKYHHQLNDHYLKLTEEALGPCEDMEEQRCYNKIISNVAKATMIQKGEFVL